VLLTTTQWSNVDPTEGVHREDNLQDESLWGHLIFRGASLERFTGTRESGLELIHKLMGKKPKPLPIQDQTAEKGMAPAETDAGRLLGEELLSLQKKREKFKRPERNQKAVKEKDDKMRRSQSARVGKGSGETGKKDTVERKLLADVHVEETKPLEEAERKERKERSERPVIAVAKKDTSVTGHLHIDDPR